MRIRTCAERFGEAVLLRSARTTRPLMGQTGLQGSPLSQASSADRSRSGDKLALTEAAIKFLGVQSFKKVHNWMHQQDIQRWRAEPGFGSHGTFLIVGPDLANHRWRWSPAVIKGC